MMNTVTVIIGEADGAPSRWVENIPWYAGMTVLQAMIMADAITEPSGHPGASDYQPQCDFSFRVTYSSMFGAFVDQIGGKSAQGGKYWALYYYLKGEAPKPSQYGVSEALLLEDAAGQTMFVEWRFEAPRANHPGAGLAKALAKPGRS
jgi:hypothetical protein